MICLWNHLHDPRPDPCYPTSLGTLQKQAARSLLSHFHRGWGRWGRRLKIWELKAFWCQDLPSDQVNGPRNLISLFLPSLVPRMPASCQLRHSLLCLRSQPVVKPQAQELTYLSFNSLRFQSLYSVGLGIKHHILIPIQKYPHLQSPPPLHPTKTPLSWA